MGAIMAKCRLCGSEARLSQSHIIPKFVFDAIKRNSPTGYLRNASRMNVRRQDGDKAPLLCTRCEARFGESESEFARCVFHPFQEGSVPPVTYGPWMSYFISSVAWRTLHLDNRGFHTEGKYSDDVLAPLDNAEHILADYLLGKRDDIQDMENHIFFLSEVSDADPELAAAHPNAIIRSSAFGYTFFDLGHGAYYVYHNLAGILICTVVLKKADEVWENTNVGLDTGTISGSQHVSSPLMYEMMQSVLEVSKVRMSDRQSAKLADELAANPHRVRESKAFRFREQDRKLRRD